MVLVAEGGCAVIDISKCEGGILLPTPGKTAILVGVGILAGVAVTFMVMRGEETPPAIETAAVTPSVEVTQPSPASFSWASPCSLIISSVSLAFV